MRPSLVFEIENVPLFKSQLLQWAKQFSKVCYLNSNVEAISVRQKFQYSKYDLLVAADAVEELTLNAGTAFEQLKNFYDSKKDWLFGYFGYDLKNETEKLVSENEDRMGFPEFHFFQPRYVFILIGQQIRVEFLKEYSTEEEINFLMEQIKILSFEKERISSSKPNIQSILKGWEKENKN